MDCLAEMIIGMLQSSLEEVPRERQITGSGERHVL
jgi:hypothetical protein